MSSKGYGALVCIGRLFLHMINPSPGMVMGRLAESRYPHRHRISNHIAGGPRELVQREALFMTGLTTVVGRRRWDKTRRVSAESG